ncbi:hypothetical protein ES319_D08G067500v1 [Gossypium barbadense]|uniref:Uncharacterized protein n=2 Tax=Gossypium TaxID=3633 RepID=A0A5J5QAJ8_GOSBA|nr:hypothetical protein ES319_D08G067500v1 [Gossypium barbadense]TYG56541.1 hypothetical protein ES288_D08G072100v1 [Gossypium darwinii]
MANLDSAMGSAFWDQTISTPQILEGSAKSVPGEPFPLDGARASKTLRIQQLSLLRNGFPLGIIPSLWLGLIGQFRPKKLISAIKTELQSADELELSVFRDAANHFLDKSLGLLELVLHMRICNDNLIQKRRKNDDIALEESRKKHCWSICQWEVHSLLLHPMIKSISQSAIREALYKLLKSMILPDHDITLDDAWPELFMDHKGRYWEVPESISLDMSSLPSDSGLLYRFCMHKNSEAPSALMPGLCAKVAFSYEKKKDFWRRKETKEDLIVKTDDGSFWQPSYDTHLKEPHATISGIIGSFAAWFGKDSASAGESQKGGNSPTTNKKESPLNMDLFSSVCYTFQHGQFWKLYGDLTRVDARLDICSLPSIAKRVVKSCWFSADSSLSFPRLNLIFQQQVAGPIVCRIDSKLLLDRKLGKGGPHIEDLIYSPSYSFRLLRSGKVVAWFSRKRKEGMIELRLFEF